MRTRPMLPNDRHGAGVSARDRHGARELHRTLIYTVASRQVRGASAGLPSARALHLSPVQWSCPLPVPRGALSSACQRALHVAGRATTTDAYPGEAQSDARSSPPNADDIRATCAEMPTLAHGFRIERPSERMYFQRRRSFPSTGDWLVDAEHRVNENAIVLHESFGGGARAYLVAMQGTRSSSSPSRGPPPSADLSARADMPASALRRSIRGPRATRGVPAAVLRTCLRAKGDWRRGAGRVERVLATTAKFS